MKSVFKIYSIIIPGIFILILSQGCKKFLKVDYPDEIVQENFWKNKSQVNTELFGLYSSFQTNARRLFLWGDLRSALYAKGNHISTEELDFIKQDIKKSNSIVSWSDTYKSINWINNFIENAPKVLERDPLFTKKELDNSLAEAYTLRALNYFYLVRAFKDVPLVKDSYSSNSQETDVPASDENEVLGFINQDLEMAYGLIDKGYDSQIERYGRVSKNMIRALWADVKLWQEDYEGAISLCEEINKEYQELLVSPESWYTIFFPGNSQESIFELQYVTDGGPSSPLWGMFSQKTSANEKFLINNARFQSIAQELYPKWPDQDETQLCGDTVRLREFAFSSAFPDNEATNIEVYKYLGTSPYVQSYRGGGNRTANLIFYRYRNVMFIEAEANAMLNRFTKAENIINKVRSAVQAPSLASGAFGTSPQEFIVNLLKERQFELGFEGGEWFATLRAANRFGLPVLEELLFFDNGAGEPVSIIKARLQNPESWYLPYYENEVLNNKNLEQKPYYNNK